MAGGKTIALSPPMSYRWNEDLFMPEVKRFGKKVMKLSFSGKSALIEYRFVLTIQ